MSDNDIYTESETHTPNPTDQVGTLDTSGTAGAAHGHLEEVTPIFEVADAQNAIVAARALDPDDTDVPESLVVLPQGQVIESLDKDAIRERVAEKAKGAEDRANAPMGVTPTSAQRKAAEEGPGAAQEAETERAEQGAGGTPTQTTERAKQGTPTQTQAPARPPFSTPSTPPA